MFHSIKNFLSYLRFVITLDYFQLVSAIIDVTILIWSIVHWREIMSVTSVYLLMGAIFVNFVWQIYNVICHFSFLKKEDPKTPLMSMLKKGETGKKDFSLIQVAVNLKLQDYPYEEDAELGVLENSKIDTLLRATHIRIYPEPSKRKHKATMTYIKQYKETLLKFLNHRWYDIQQKRGGFTNDKKLCLASEVYHRNTGEICWRITSGRYYNGELTNNIYTKYVGGTHYKLYPPVHMNTDPIKPLGESDFSDHIGVSTLLLTFDDYFYIFRQAGNAGYNANCYMPTGSGSVDYSDYKRGDDFRQIIVRAAERELSEESSIKKLMGKTVFCKNVNTTVIGYYRDMERGGKPEFCCVSKINMSATEVEEYIRSNKIEIADNSIKKISSSNTQEWNDCIAPEASLSLKMNYKYLSKHLSDN